MKVKKTTLLNFLLATVCIASSFQAVSQSTHKIKVRVDGVSDTTVYLANYYGNKLYYNDTTRADANGYFEFDGKPFEEGGKYAIVIPGPKYFDILVTDEDIHIETKASDLVGNLQVIESKENKFFFDYLKFLADKRTERDPLDAQLGDSTLTEKKREALVAQLQELNQEVVDHQKELVAQHPEMLASKLIKMTFEPDVPTPPDSVKNPDTWKYYQYRKHYWDRVDLDDPRLVRDQMFHKLLEKYFTKILPQAPDSLAIEAPKLADMMRNPDMFKYTTHYLTYTSETSNIMCMDKVFVTMVNKYYRTGKADWLDDEQLEKVLESADKKKYVLCGEPVPNIILPDTTLTNWKSLYDLDSKYTLVVIWEGSCGHCKKEVPKLYELYQKWKPYGLEVYSIGNDFETEPWMEFIHKHDLDWLNVSDNPQINQTDSATKLIYSGITTLPSLNFRTTFDVFSTPRVVLLDEEKRVIAKQLSHEQLDEMLNHLEGIESPAVKPEDEDAPKQGAKPNKGSKAKSKP